MPVSLLLIACWAPGLAAYAGALWALHGETMSIDNWAFVGLLTLIAWLVASVFVTLPVLLRLSRNSGGARGPLLTAGAALAILPVWLTMGMWVGWHLRHLLSEEAVLLGVLYGTSGLLLGMWLSRRTPRSAA